MLRLPRFLLLLVSTTCSDVTRYSFKLLERSFLNGQSWKKSTHTAATPTDYGRRPLQLNAELPAQPTNEAASESESSVFQLNLCIAAVSVGLIL
jgi:hypothetical protein